MIRIALASLTLAAVPPAQQAGVVRLPPANARIEQEFSDLTTLRELTDGRVLVFDRREERLVVASFANGTVRDVARKGQGPREFEYVAALLALPGDSTIAADQTRRWLILAGDSVVAKLLSEHVALQRIALEPLGADRSGHVLTRSFGGGISANPDSTTVLLVHRVTGQTDTITQLANNGRRGPVSAVTAPGRMRVVRVPLMTGESALLFPDGWIAVVRVDPYRVDWRAPEGRWTLGRPLPFRAVRTTAAEKAAFIRRKPGFRNATDWPDELPPFETPVTLLASPEGQLLIRRLPTRAEPGIRYDVIDRTGGRRMQLVLPENQHILGFGAASAYVIETDDDGIQRLRRHPWLTSLRP
jgi:hypothetical protein